MIDKDSLQLDKPRRTPDHPTKSHVVKTMVDGKEKIIRFGQQGAKTAGAPKAGESEAMKQKRASFKARHAANIAKGKSSAAYWADKVKWASGGSVDLQDLDQKYEGIKKPDFKLLESFRQMISDLQSRAEDAGTQEFDPIKVLGRSNAAPSLEDLYASYADAPVETHGRRAEAGAPTDRKVTARMVFDSFKNAGFSDAQASALTAEINREGSFNPAYLYGSHTDAANKATNVGMLSWQGDRANRLMSFMADQNLLDPEGRITPGQNALDAQADYLRWEMEHDPEYAQTRETFLANPEVDPKTAHDVLGRNFIRWRMDDPAYRDSGMNRINEGYDLLGVPLGYAKGGLKKPKISGSFQYKSGSDDDRRTKNASGSLTFSGERGSITPGFSYSKNTSSNQLSDGVVVDNVGRRIGVSIGGELFLDDVGENKLRAGASRDTMTNNNRVMLGDDLLQDNAAKQALLNYYLGLNLGPLSLDVSKSGDNVSGRGAYRVGKNAEFSIEGSNQQEPTFGFQFNKNFKEGGLAQLENKYAEGGLVGYFEGGDVSKAVKENPIWQHHMSNVENGKTVKNKDGSVSTVRTIIVGDGQYEYLIPTVWDGKILSEQDAWDRAMSSGIGWPKAPAGEKGVASLEHLDQQLHKNMTPTGFAEGGKVKKNATLDSMLDDDPALKEWYYSKNRALPKFSTAGFLIDPQTGEADLTPLPEKDTLTTWDPSVADRARGWLSDRLTNLGVDKYGARNVSERLLGKPFVPPETDALSGMLDSAGLLGMTGVTGLLDAKQAQEDVGVGNYGDAALSGASAALNLLPFLRPVGRAAKSAVTEAGPAFRKAADTVMDRMNQLGEMPTTYSNPIPGLLDDTTRAEALSDMASKYAADEGKGFRVYQGSPHDFAAERLVRMPDGSTQYIVGRPDVLPEIPEGAEVLKDFPLGRQRMDKIGTGEGAQAYGYGLYGAEAENVAKGYRDTLANGWRLEVRDPLREAGITGRELDSASQMLSTSYSGKAAADDWENWTGKTLTPEQRSAFEEAFARKSGRVYELEVNANPEDFIDFEAPWDAQPEAVKRYFAYLAKGERKPTGQDLAQRIEGPIWAKEAADAGIPGIRYLDAGSRGMGYKIKLSNKGKPYETEPITARSRKDAERIAAEYRDKGFDADIQQAGSRNYVVFDENLINIVRKYGIAGAAVLLGMSREDVAQAMEQQSGLAASQYDPNATASRIHANNFAEGGAVKYDPAAIDNIINKLREVNRG